MASQTTMTISAPIPTASSVSGANKMPRTLPSKRLDDDEKQGDMAKLPIASCDSDFFGRSEELEMLHKAKQQVIDDSQDNADAPSAIPLLPAVLVWGVSGTGKSHLIQQFLEETKQQSACYVLQGKYDEYTGSSDPFSALVQALNDFSSQLQSGPLEELERIRKCVEEAFGGNGSDDGESSPLAALINVVPSLSILLDSRGSGASIVAGSTNISSTFDSASSVASTSSERSQLRSTLNSISTTDNVWNRLQYVFLQFVKAISTKERPVYLFLDDLQWSSNVALELLASLISDAELENFLFLGSIRQETNPHNDEVLEVDTTSALSACFLSRLQSQPKELTQIITQNLSLDDTVQFLANLLDDHPIDDKLNVLTQKIHIKTQGNIFFTMQALEELQRNKVLTYDEVSVQWEWNLDGANGDDISISSNVIGVIASKLKHLPQDLQDVLTIAAYVRATFEVTALLQVVQNEQRNAGASPFFLHSTQAINKEYLTSLLEKAVLEQLLTNSIGGTTYRFAHDRIQQAAYSMIPDGEVRNMLRLRIGHCLLRLHRERHQHYQDSANPTEGLISKKTRHHQGTLPSADDDGLLFVAADHLNSVPTKDHMFAVMLNLEVGERAIQMAALASAANYLERAANELQSVRNSWKDHYDISLRLCRARSDVELSLGHFEVGYSLGDQVLKNAKTLDEKLPTYLSMAHGLGREDKPLKSFDMCLRAATQLGGFPKRWYLSHIVRDMIKIKSFLKKNDDDAILRLPIITDERKLMSMRLLTELGVRAMITQNMVIFLLNVCKHARHTIQFGLCEDSAFAFVCYGLLSGANGDHSMAIRCAGLANRIISKTKGTAVAGWISLTIAGFIVPFSLPVADVIEEHRRGYTKSMEVGEFEVGFMNWQGCVTMAYLAGNELQSLVQATETTLQQYKMYRVESMSRKAVEYLSMMQMLAGKKPIDWDEIDQLANRDIKSENLAPSERVEWAYHFYRSMVVAMYFRRYDLGNKLAGSFRYVTAEEKYAFIVISRGVYPGINAAERYRETGKRKDLRTLKKILAKMRNIAKARGSKFIHHVFMLKAELASVQKQKQNSGRVKEAYDLAILVASNAAFVQDAALTCELAGEYCIREGYSKAETSAYFVKAVGFYEDWGCVVKVDDLKQRRSEYLAGLDENRRVTDTNAQDGRMVLFGNDPSSSRGNQMNVLSNLTPSIPAMGTSIADSGTKRTFGLQEQSVADDCDLSVLTDGSK